MTSYYMRRYFKNQTFYKIQSQSIIDNPDQRIVDDLSSFTATALGFALTFFNAAVDLISFSNILYGIYPPLFIVLLVYSIGGTAISVYLGKVIPLPDSRKNILLNSRLVLNYVLVCLQLNRDSFPV